jgi:hypothetical protein
MPVVALTDVAVTADPALAVAAGIGAEDETLAAETLAPALAVGPEMFAAPETTDRGYPNCGCYLSPLLPTH